MRREQAMAPLLDDALTKHLPRSDGMARALIALLDDENPYVQEGAALALGEQLGSEVVKALGRKLYPTECVEPRVRAMAAGSLAKIKSPAAIPYLEIGLNDPHRDVRIAACNALKDIDGDHARPALERVLLPHDRDLMVEAARALNEIGGISAEPILDNALKNLPRDGSFQETRAAIAEALAKGQRVASHRRVENGGT